MARTTAWFQNVLDIPNTNSAFFQFWGGSQCPREHRTSALLPMQASPSKHKQERYTSPYTKAPLLLQRQATSKTALGSPTTSALRPRALRWPKNLLIS